jgi:two-component system cell cycle sensor histidine kinase/response regulator CckA
VDAAGDAPDAMTAAMFRAFANSAGSYVSCIDRDRRIRFLNRTLSRELSEIIGRRTEEFVAEPRRAAMVRAVEAAFAGQRPEQLEYEVELADGRRLWLVTQILPFRGPGDEPLALQLTTDLTEQRRLLAELSKSEDFRKLIVENLPDFVMLLDRERRFRWINRVSPGVDMSRLLGACLDDFITPTAKDTVRHAVESVFATRQPTEYEAIAVSANQQRTWYSTRVLPIAGDRETVLLISSDVSRQKAAELALRESEERFRALAEHSPDLIAIINPRREIEYVNREPPWRAPGSSVGQRLDDFMLPSQIAAALSAIEAVFTRGETGEYEASEPNQNTLYRVRVAPLGWTGERERALVVSTDITQARADERARESLQAQLHQAQRRETIGALAGGIAHDFNNLLQVILTNLHFAEEQVAPQNLASAELREAIRASERAAELTAHLLAIGRRQRVDPQCVDLSRLIERSLRMLRRVIPENIELVFEGAPEPCPVWGDPPQLEQVLLNLCLNARDAMPNGGKLLVSVRGVRGSPRRAELVVADTGIGISPEQLKRIFEPFFSTKGAGSGLGLAVVAGIVAAHNGAVTVDSEEGRGSTFKVGLPLAAKSAPETSPAPSESVRGSELILVAEDEPLVRAQVVRILSRAGYSILEAEDGLKALELFAQHRDSIRMVLLDVIMPGMDGWQVFLRLEATCPAVKVAFTTGYAADALPEDFGTRGKRLLSKPYKPDALLALVRDVLSSN